MYAVAVWKLKRLKKSGGFVRLFLFRKFKTFLIPVSHYFHVVFQFLEPVTLAGKEATVMEKNWLGLEGKVFIVTGGASGIGKAVVEELLSDGAKVSV